MSNVRDQLRFAVNGVTLAADAMGDPDASLVLLLHGGGQTRHAWQSTAIRLAASGRYAVTVDLRGHGESSWAGAGQYEVDDFAADLHEIRMQLDRPTTFVGASLGGVSSLVAVAGAQDQSSFASALALIDIAPRLEPVGVSRILGFLNARPDGFESLEEVADALAQYNPHRPRRASPDGLRRNMRQRSDGRWVWLWDPAVFADDQEVSLVQRISRRVDAAARRLTVPTLLVRGLESDALSEDGVADLVNIVPHLEVARVANAGHMVAGDQNDDFNDAIVNFLDRAVPVNSESREA